MRDSDYHFIKKDPTTKPFLGLFKSFSKQMSLNDGMKTYLSAIMIIICCKQCDDQHCY